MTDKNFVDKIGLADLLNLEEIVAEDETKRKRSKGKKKKSQN